MLTWNALALSQWGFKTLGTPFRTLNSCQLTSLPFQILLTVHVWYYFAFIFVLEVALLVYKGCVLPYPLGTWILEVLLLLFATATEALRNFQGQKGNLTEQLSPVIIAVVLALPLIFSTLYFTLWQMYVLRVELITNSIQLALLVLETLLGIFVAITLSKTVSN